MKSKVKFRSSDTNFSTGFSETSYVAPPQPDWEQQDANSADYIKNKPDLNVYSTHEDAKEYAENAAQAVREEHKEDQEITNEKFNILKEEVYQSESFVMEAFYGELDAISEIVEIPSTDPDQGPDVRRMIKNDNIDWSTVTDGLQTILDALNTALGDGEV